MNGIELEPRYFVNYFTINGIQIFRLRIETQTKIERKKDTEYRKYLR